MSFEITHNEHIALRFVHCNIVYTEHYLNSCSQLKIDVLNEPKVFHYLIRCKFYNVNASYFSTHSSKAQLSVTPKSTPRASGTFSATWPDISSCCS